MKKTWKAVVVVLTMLMVCLALVGCSQNTNPLVGKWVQYDTGGVNTYIERIWEFHSDGIFQQEVKSNFGTKTSQNNTGNYNVSDNNLTISVDNTPEQFVWSITTENNLSLVYDSRTLTFFKVDTVEATKNKLKFYADALDSSCKNYYAEVVAGTLCDKNAHLENITYDTLPEAKATDPVKKAAAQKCTVYGAMQYADLTDMESSLSEFCYDTTTGTIYANMDETKPSTATKAFTKDTTLGELYNK